MANFQMRIFLHDTANFRCCRKQEAINPRTIWELGIGNLDESHVVITFLAVKDHWHLQVDLEETLSGLCTVNVVYSLCFKSNFPTCMHSLKVFILP